MEIIDNNSRKIKKYRHSLSKRVKRKKRFKKFTLFIFGCIVLAVFIINIQLALTLYNNKLKLDTTTGAQERTIRLISQLIDDSKEMRKTLQLPPLLYEQDLSSGNNINELALNSLALDDLDIDGLGYETLNGTSQALTYPNNDTNEPNALSKQVGLIYDTFHLEQVSQNLSEIIEEYKLHAYAKKLDFHLQQKNNKIIIRYKTYIIATLEALYNENFSIQQFQYESSLIGKQQTFEIKLIKEIINKVKTQLQKNIRSSLALQKSIKKLFASNEIKKFLTDNRGRIVFKAYENMYSWMFYNILKQEVFFLTLSKFDYKIKTSSTSLVTNKSIKHIVSDIKNTLQSINFKTEEEQIVLSNIEKVKTYIADTTFQNRLQALGLSISPTVRQNSDYHYLDIFETTTHKKIGAFAILKSTGSFWSIDKDDVPIAQTSIFNIAPKEIYKQYTNQNILLVGSHNKLADTIILVHINKNNEIKLISIPRDIYYQGRKLNWYFKRFSPNNFNRVVSDITGVPIIKYVFVDMYSFISIIDILGGVNVVLTQPLIDTSYKIKDNGVLSYLNYDAGEHHVTGIEALRIARSRYSTSDFNRSTRQQAIIEGIKKELNSVDNLSAFLSIVKALDSINPVTNLSTIEITTMVSKYKNASISDRMVLSTSNALYSTYTNIYEKKIQASDFNAENVDKGQWILLPKNNDWNSLQNYIERFIIK